MISHWGTSDVHTERPGGHNNGCKSPGNHDTGHRYLPCWSGCNNGVSCTHISQHTYCVTDIIQAIFGKYRECRWWVHFLAAITFCSDYLWFAYSDLVCSVLLIPLAQNRWQLPETLLTYLNDTYICQHKESTHLPPVKMTAISQTTFSNAFLSTIFINWKLSRRVWLAMSQDWFR